MVILPKITNRAIIRDSVIRSLMLYLFINLRSSPFEFLTEKMKYEVFTLNHEKNSLRKRKTLECKIG